MPTVVPPDVAVSAFMAPTTRHTRRVEIYERDGVTPWAKCPLPDFIDGTISVDIDRDERRSIDLILDNSDGILVNAPGEFWYDKIIKVYRGVHLPGGIPQPRIGVVADTTAGSQAFYHFRNALNARGFGKIYLDTGVSTYADTQKYDIIVDLDGTPTSAQILKQVYNAGRPFLAAAGGAWFLASELYGYSGPPIGPADMDSWNRRGIAHPVALGWSSFTVEDSLEYSGFPLTASSELTAITTVEPGNSFSAVMAAENTSTGARGVFIQSSLNHPGLSDTEQFRNLLAASINWLFPPVPTPTWEVQIGEFMIDTIEEAHSPRHVHVTGRDYTKKLMLSKYITATQYNSGSDLNTVLLGILTAGGVNRYILPTVSQTLGASFFFERNVTRWEAIKQICEAHGLSPYFDALGNFVAAPVADPYLQPSSVTIKTGAGGNVATYQKSTNDSRIFNVVVVTGESSDASVPPVYYVAKNDDPDSPTSIQNLGERVQEYNSALVTTTAQAQDLAETYLSISALEEYALNFETLMMPWLEGSDIVRWEDPRPAPDDPENFLLTSIEIPLTLSPMGSTAKRIIKVV